MKVGIYKQKDFLYGKNYRAIIRQKEVVTRKDFKTFKGAKTWLDRETRRLYLKSQP
jgi:hypothetical protein